MGEMPQSHDAPLSQGDMLLLRQYGRGKGLAVCFGVAGGGVQDVHVPLLPLFHGVVPGEPVEFEFLGGGPNGRHGWFFRIGTQPVITL